MAKKSAFDRAAEDMGNIVALEHVNLTVTDQITATDFYVTGLGLTRDPYLNTASHNMWVNVGRSQFHLPSRSPQQVLRGRIGLVMPDLDRLAKRLESVKKNLKGTKFKFGPAKNGARKRNDAIDIICPWGNRMRCHAAGGKFAPMALGIPYLEFDVPSGAAKGIAKFYREIYGADSRLSSRDGAPAAFVPVGHRQELIFRETKAKLPKYDGHHIQIYIADFSGPHAKLLERGLITEESNPYQYRVVDIVDVDSGKKLFEIEHEVRSMTHPLYTRSFVNRDPEQSLQAFAPGHENRSWALPLAS